jgi:hypothetical protein
VRRALTSPVTKRTTKHPRCSYDQFSNIVLEDCAERRCVNDTFCDEPVGLFILRGDQIVLLGEIVDTRLEDAKQFVDLDKFKAVLGSDPQARAQLKSAGELWNFDKA